MLSVEKPTRARSSPPVLQDGTQLAKAGQPRGDYMMELRDEINRLMEMELKKNIIIKQPDETC